MSKQPLMEVTHFEAFGYAVLWATREAQAKGTISKEAGDALLDRADTLFAALVAGKVINPVGDGTVEIITRNQAGLLAAQESGDLVIGDDA